MENKSEADFQAGLTPEQKNLYEFTQQKIKELRSQPTPAVKVLKPEDKVNAEKRVAPLVQKIIPNTIIGRPHVEKTNNFIEAVHTGAPVSTATSQGTKIEDSYTFAGFQDFYNLVKANPSLQHEQEVIVFVQLVDSIPNACGCVRGALNESAQGQFAQFLPIIQARNPRYFEEIKAVTNTNKLIFKENQLVLLEV